MKKLTWIPAATDHYPQDAILRSMELYFGIFSHEINSQLAGIKQCCESIQEGKAIGRDNTDFYLQSIHRISCNALNVLNNLLTTVKFHAGKLDIQLKKETFCFSSWVKADIQPFEADTVRQGKNICLTLHPILLNTDITADKVKLGQILNNLLANALKFSYPGTCIVVHCYMKDSGLIMQVINQGDGIPGEVLPVLFKPYQQLVEGSSGTGLGLYICQLFVEAMSGKIDVVSEEKTTVFTVHIPNCFSKVQKNIGNPS
jgi:signal transduction histidine kinase